MAQEVLDNVLDEIKTLTRDELCRVDTVIWERLSTVDDEAARREAFHRALLEAGIVKKVNDPRNRSAVEPQLVEVIGKPLSETILEDRG